MSNETAATNSEPMPLVMPLPEVDTSGRASFLKHCTKFILAVTEKLPFFVATTSNDYDPAGATPCSPEERPLRGPAPPPNTSLTADMLRPREDPLRRFNALPGLRPVDLEFLYPISYTQATSVAFRRAKFNDISTTYVAKSYRYLHIMQKGGTLPELGVLLRNLSSLQGRGVPRLLGYYTSPPPCFDFTVATSLPHDVFWVEASRDMPRALKQRCVDVFRSIHERGVCHGDVQLKNMLIGADGRVTIIDFKQSTCTEVAPEIGVHPATRADLRLEMRKVKFVLNYEKAVDCERAKYRRHWQRQKANEAEIRRADMDATHIANLIPEPPEDVEDPPVNTDDWMESTERIPQRYIVPGRCREDVQLALQNFIGNFDLWNKLLPPPVDIIPQVVAAAGSSSPRKRKREDIDESEGRSAGPLLKRQRKFQSRIPRPIRLVLPPPPPTFNNKPAVRRKVRLTSLDRGRTSLIPYNRICRSHEGFVAVTLDNIRDCALQNLPHPVLLRSEPWNPRWKDGPVLRYISMHRGKKLPKSVGRIKRMLAFAKKSIDDDWHDFVMTAFVENAKNEEEEIVINHKNRTFFKRKKVKPEAERAKMEDASSENRSPVQATFTGPQLYRSSSISSSTSSLSATDTGGTGRGLTRQPRMALGPRTRSSTSKELNITSGRDVDDPPQSDEPQKRKGLPRASRTVLGPALNLRRRSRSRSPLSPSSSGPIICEPTLTGSPKTQAVSSPAEEDTDSDTDSATDTDDDTETETESESDSDDESIDSFTTSPPASPIKAGPTSDSAVASGVITGSPSSLKRKRSASALDRYDADSVEDLRENAKVFKAEENPELKRNPDPLAAPTRGLLRQPRRTRRTKVDVVEDKPVLGRTLRFGDMTVIQYVPERPMTPPPMVSSVPMDASDEGLDDPFLMRAMSASQGIIPEVDPEVEEDDLVMDEKEMSGLVVDDQIPDVEMSSSEEDTETEEDTSDEEEVQSLLLDLSSEGEDQQADRGKGSETPHLWRMYTTVKELFGSRRFAQIEVDRY